MESSESLILNEIIKPGKQFFENFLSQQINNRKIDKRKKINKSLQNHALNNATQSYSVFNLIKTPNPTLSDSELVAGQLLKTNFLNQKRSINQNEEESIKYYEDYERTQKINKKFTKIFLKPLIATNNAEKIGEEKLVRFQQTFTAKSKQLIDEMSNEIMSKIQEKNHPKPKLKTQKAILDQSNNQMIYFASDAKNLFKKVQFHTQVNKFTKDFLNETFQNLKEKLGSNSVKLSMQHEKQEKFQEFESYFQSLLPYYLQRSYHQNFSPLPWKSGLLQKEIQRSKFPLITGKVLYKYEHNLILLKENQIKLQIFQYGNKKYDMMMDYVQKIIFQKQKKQRKGGYYQKEDINNRQTQINDNRFKKSQQVESDNSKRKDFTSKDLILKNFRVAKIIQPRDTQQSFAIPKISNQNKNGYDYRSLNNVISIDIRNNSQVFRKNSLFSQQSQHKQGQFKFSKSSYFGQEENFPEDKKKNALFPRNIYMIDQPKNSKSIQSRVNYFQQRSYGQFFNRNDEFQQGNFPIRENNPSKSLQFLSDSNSSDCWNQIRRYQEGKTTKKKKSFNANKPQKSAFMKKSQNQNIKLMSKKNLDFTFYPLKLGNLILQQNQRAYLEYNCQKEDPKSLSMKFLLDCKKHGVNKIELIVPSLKSREIKSKEQQKVKQTIKTLLSLGGEILKLKPQSAYDQQSRKNQFKVSAELQIYKFYYSDLSYFDIIDSLDIEDEWLEKERESVNVGGWKY